MKIFIKKETMKKIIAFILALTIHISLVSCVTSSYADDDVDVNVVISYGTPYYNESGLLMYYIYNNRYYYPYYHLNRWHLRHYARPLPPRSYRPVHRDFYRHRPYHRPNVGGNRGFGNHRPNGGHMRPNNRPRSGNGRFGHRR